MSRPEVVYAVAAAAANLLGALAVTSHTRWTLEALDTLVALSAGFIIAVALVDLFPEALAHAGSGAAPAALAGYMMVHLTQHTLAPHFHFGEETHKVSKGVGVSALVGLLLHTFVDGVAIASSSHVGPALGALVFTAVLLHKFPEGLAISSIFLAAGLGRSRALLAAAALGAATLLGVLVTDSVGALADYGLALSAGVALYVGASNLVPEFQARRGWRLPAAFFAGCGLYLAARTTVGLR